MSDWKAKRFWKEATVEQVEGGFLVLLDGRQVRTPAKAILMLPTRGLAEVVAAEWDAQEDEINPTTMPFTRSANAAIDKVSVNRDAVINMLAEYGDSDLLSYRAAQPDGLVARQSKHWDPVIAWAETTYGIRMTVAEGVMHVPQNRTALDALKREVADQGDFSLAAFHDLVCISGSLILALGVKTGELPPEKAWDLSRVDEVWQTEQWGEDDEASANESIKRDAFLDAARFLTLAAT